MTLVRMAYSWKSWGRQLRAQKLYFSESPGDRNSANGVGERKLQMVSLASNTLLYSISAVLEPRHSLGSMWVPCTQSTRGGDGDLGREGAKGSPVWRCGRLRLASILGWHEDHTWSLRNPDFMYLAFLFGNFDLLMKRCNIYNVLPAKNINFSHDWQCLGNLISLKRSRLPIIIGGDMKFS